MFIVHYMKSKVVACLLALFFGCWGVHWFYLGNSRRGVVYLIIGLLGLLFWFPLMVTGLLSFIDFIMFIASSDFDSKYNKDRVDPLRQQQSYQAPQPQQFYDGRQTQSPRNPGNSEKNTKKCPYCGEEILAVAKKCKFCGEWLDNQH